MSFSKFKLSDHYSNSYGFVSNKSSVHHYMYQNATLRSMSNGRFISTILSLLLGLFLIYTSFFYFPAYSTKPSFIKVSAQNNIKQINDKTALVDNRYLNYLLMNQGYLKTGQTVTVDYKISPGAELYLTVTKCSGPAVVEVYSCRGSLIKTFKLTQKSGRFGLSVKDSGFYKFNQVLTDTSAQNSTFEAIWKRK